MSKSSMQLVASAESNAQSLIESKVDPAFMHAKSLSTRESKNLAQNLRSQNLAQNLK